MFGLATGGAKLFVWPRAAKFLTRRSGRLSDRIEHRSRVGLFLFPRRHFGDYSRQKGASAVFLLTFIFKKFIFYREMDRDAPLRHRRQSRPFWLPASNYYVMAAAVAIGFFFLVWGILHDEGDETPWVSAGVGASILLGGAVVLREIVLRRARERYLQMERRVRENVSGARVHLGDRASAGGKLTLQKNAAILKEIRKKSDAAKVLGRFAAGHREVFEYCGEYLARNEAELTTVNAGSPRLAALLKGRNTVSQLHRYHLLQWAEIEARDHTSAANSLNNADDRLRAANEALNVVEFGLTKYPAERRLLESREVLRELLVSIKVTDLVERAVKAVFGHDNRLAISLYSDALYYLRRDNNYTPESRAAAARIDTELQRLRLLEGRE
jgi:hypothetical protein